MKGDLCIVGWMQSESSDKGEYTKIPIILGWVLPGVWLGRDWVTGSDFPLDEYDFDAPKDQAMVEGTHDRIRHKLRHMQPGNIIGCSAQGSDLVLDESATLSNRRGNEFILRDQDQAIVARSLQQFHAMAGARIYAGMVQRDATLLAPYMVSDGKIWDGNRQALLGDPINETELPGDPTAPEGFLTPAMMLRKQPLSAEKGYLGRSTIAPDPYIDPYDFFRRGGFINESGYVVDEKHIADGLYGGKPIFRVANQKKGNAVLDPQAATLTEWRLEVAHTSDGRLPVTEQTDQFDADRLPDEDPSVPKIGQEKGSYIEMVMGSVVGNDPFTTRGREQYGLPLKTVIFEGNTPVPRIEAASITEDEEGLSSTPLGEQAATLFRLSPPLPGNQQDTFWSVNKAGQFKASIGGDRRENSVEAFLAGGLKLGIKGGFEVLMDGHVEFGTLAKNSLHLTAREGPVKIYGGGTEGGGSAVAERLSGTGGGEGDLPSVDIQARTNAWLQAQKKVFIKGATIEEVASQVKITGQESVSIDGIKQLSMTSDKWMTTVNGRCQQSFAGPKDLLPTNMPLHERSYTSLFPGLIAEKVTYNQGDREEMFVFGKHTTTVLVGTMSYEVALGSWKASAVGNSVELSAGGVSATAVSGTVSLTAVAGSATMSGMSGVTLVSSGGVATVKGASGMILSAPVAGPDQGPILCAGSLEPFTNLPFATWGLGAKNHLVTP